MMIIPIASGSSGNCYYVTNGLTEILLDAGVPIKKIEIGTGYRISRLDGCLITHGHGDHVLSASKLAKMGVNIYTSQGTIDMAGLEGHRIHNIAALEKFRIGTFVITPFDVEHDVPEPLGFLIEDTHTAEKVLYVTDAAYIKYKFTGLTHIMIEANHGYETIENNVSNGLIDVHRSVRTIRSHMSIDTTIRTLLSMDLSKVKTIILLHLSNDNSVADDFKRRVQEATGKEVYIA